MKINIRHSFAVRLSLYTITCVVIIFIGVLFYNYQVSKKLIIENTFENVKNLAGLTLNRVDSILIVVRTVSEDMASFIEFSNQTESELSSMLRSVVQSNPTIYGSTISFEPYKFSKDKYYFGPAFHKSKDGIKFLDIGTPKYDYFKWDWYTEPKKLGHGVWSEPYFGTGGGVFMVTYSQPVYKKINGKREFCGVAECDIALDWLVDMISKINECKGYAFLLSSKGNFIAHPNKEYYTKGKSFFSVNPNKKLIGEEMIAGKTGFIRYFSHTLNKMAYTYYQPLSSTKWSLGIVIPEDELYSKLQWTTFKLLLIGLVGYILTLIMIVLVVNFAITPLRSLIKATIKIGEGDFNAQIPIPRYRDEIGVLSHSFRSMQGNLIKYITNLKETTAAKEKIDKELSIAREIQQSLLPHKFPQLKQIDLYATLIPAKDVGGDLYDFFFIDEKHLCFAIGDVSGKGVPASLFMAVTKTLLRAKISIAMDPAKVLNAMNEDLCRENESCMFVTFFLGVLDIDTGILEYCNAGHTPPLIHTASKGFYYFHTEDPHPPLGIMADVDYVGNKLKLLPEDIFFLYTDGVTEAMNIDYILFSEEKLLDVLAKNKDDTVSNIINTVKTAVEQHVSGAVHSDDITMLIFKYNG
jgi:sigma-B regulation protein RsbU (phosphoserine phosphatase)